MTTTVDARPGRSKILDVAAQSFLDFGYDGTSLRQIANTVGIKAGSIYYHFDSKDELLLAVLRQGIEVMDTAFDEASRSTRDDTVYSTGDETVATTAETIVGAHVRAHLSALFENGAFTAAHVTTFRTAPQSVRDEIVAWRDAYEARWTKLLKKLQRNGELAADVDIRLARLSLFGAMNSAVEWFDPRRGSLDRFASTVTRQFLYGVAR